MRKFSNGAEVVPLSGAEHAPTAARLQLSRVDGVIVSPKLRGRVVEPGVTELTGSYLTPNDPSVLLLPEIPDPSPPFELGDGRILITGSAPVGVVYPNWEAFESGGEHGLLEIDLRHPNRVPARGEYSHPWDVRIYRVLPKEPHQAEEMVILAGSMIAPPGVEAPRWPDDNGNRRLFLFRGVPDHPGVFVRSDQPVVGSLDSGYADHSYGGNYFQPGNPDVNLIDLRKPVWLFYEKVTDATNGVPRVTEIFVMRMRTLTEPEGEPIKIIGVSKNGRPYPSTRRTSEFGGHLVEGPRPIEITLEGKTFYVVGFSGSDFCTDRYFSGFAWATSVEGPYHVIENSEGDIRDFGAELRRRYGWSFVGRPVLFHTPRGTIGMMVRAVEKTLVSENDYSEWAQRPLDQFYRKLNRIDVRVKLDSAGGIGLLMPWET